MTPPLPTSAPMPTLVGILNVTPDSFSDGGKYLQPEQALAHARKLVADGADIIDVGGVSTRPGSEAISPEDEWDRIREVVSELSQEHVVSVDTFHASVAEKALQAGATIINNVFPHVDPELYSVVARSGAKLVVMRSRCSVPHVFDPPPEGDIIELTCTSFEQFLADAERAGLGHDQLILDAGMGGFISGSPATSWELIHRFGELTSFELPLYFGSSRKGFLKSSQESDVCERDPLSALSAVLAYQASGGAVPFYVRVHDVALHRRFFEAALGDFLP